MGFLSSIFSATVKTVLTPISIIKDAGNIITGNEINSTSNLLESAVEDVDQAFNDLGDGEIL